MTFLSRYALNALLLAVTFGQVLASVHSYHRHTHGHRHRKLAERIAGDKLTARDDTFLYNNTGQSLVEPTELFRRQSSSSGGQTGGSPSTSSSGDYSCGMGKPCGNGACCGKDGWCGYGPTYCGDGCQSNCDAKAECGEFAATPGKGCPLNVCCSQYGFCGTTADFCGDGCQSHCDQPKPNAGTSNPRKLIGGYYEGWSMTKPCGSMPPEEIPVHSLTHLFFSFGFIAPGTFRIEPMVDFQPSLFGRVTDLKMKNPNLKVLIALGGWTHNDPGPYQKVFSDMAASAANRQLFIRNLLGFMSQYAFDGVDVDWEYPGADDRGGVPKDGENFNLLLQDIKDAFKKSGQQYLLTFTAPTSYWYLRHFDIKESAKIVDWVNLMSYDLHGVWDRDNPIGNQVLGHTNLTEIDLALDLFWRNDVSPDKIVLGTGFYGRSFRLEDPSCWKPGCKFMGPGEKGPCTQTEGFLSYKEVKDLLQATKAKPYLDKEASVQYITYGQNSWISYDDPKTIQMKVDFAAKRGLKGLMTWAIDLDDEKGDLIKALSGGQLNGDEPLELNDDGPSISHGTSDATRCYITGCKGSCDKGYTPVGRCNTDLNGKNRCNTKKPEEARFICCPSFSGPTPDECRWDDKRSSIRKEDCSGKCEIGEINVINDSFGWKGTIYGGSYGDQCWRGAKSFCCKAGNMERYLDICTWSKCDEQCPSDKPFVLTTDTGGPRSNPRCGWEGSGDPFSGEGRGFRRLCCPKKDSFKNCNWQSAKVCSSQCPLDQITLDLDPRGPNPSASSCDNGREMAFCCDPPGGKDQPFAPFDLENLFPPEHLPPADALPNYDLISFGGRFENIGLEDPNLSGVAFFLIAGSGTAVTSMKKRDNPGLEFLDCPADVLSRPDYEHQSARVICMHANVTDCFKVRDGGVEGTVVQMPNECGGPSWSRAVALTFSKNQTVPDHIAARGPTSAVFDFTFDYNIPLVRRDAGDYSIRIDYSNVPGYWKAVVDSPGMKKRGLHELVDRFYGTSDGWYNKFGDLEFRPGYGVEVNERLDRLVYHKGQFCDYEGDEEVGESISIALQGNSKVEAHYGFSLIATWRPGSEVQIHQAAGFFRPQGETDLTIKMGGSGVLDTAEALQGPTLKKTFGMKGISGHNLYRGWAYFKAYKETGVRVESGKGHAGAVPFSGYMEARSKSDWGKFTVNFPVGAVGTPGIGAGNGDRLDDRISRSNTNHLTPVEQTPEGFIEIGATMKLGLQAGMSFSAPYSGAVRGELPDMSVSQYVYARWLIDNKGSESCLSTSLGTTMESQLLNGAYSGWKDKDTRPYVQARASTGGVQCFTGDEPAKHKRMDLSFLEDKLDFTAPSTGSNVKDLVARQNDLPFGEIPLPGDNLEDFGWNGMAPAITCNGCNSCTLENPLRAPCCGCVCLACRYGFVPDKRFDKGLEIDGLSTNAKRSSFVNITDDVDVSDVAQVFDLEERDLEIRAPTDPSQTRKEMKIFGVIVQSQLYPSYPNYKRDPTSQRDFDNFVYSQGIMKYFHNSSSLCTSWAVGRFPTSDMVWDPTMGRFRKQFYQTEHPFEGQFISRFMEEWMLKNAATPMTQSTVRTNLVIQNAPWPGSGGAVAWLMGQQLGSRDRQDRLAVLLTNSNRMKGAIAQDINPIEQNYWTNLEAGDAQLAYMKEFGMVFAYMNNQDVWGAFCASYNGMRDVLLQYDGVRNTDLAGEWQLFMRAELVRMVTSGRTSSMYLYNSRKTVPGFWKPWWYLKWWGMFNGPLSQYGYINLNLRCVNLQ